MRNHQEFRELSLRFDIAKTGEMYDYNRKHVGLLITHEILKEYYLRGTL